MWKVLGLAYNRHETQDMYVLPMSMEPWADTKKASHYRGGDTNGLQTITLKRKVLLNLKVINKISE